MIANPCLSLCFLPPLPPLPSLPPSLPFLPPSPPSLPPLPPSLPLPYLLASQCTSVLGSSDESTVHAPSDKMVNSGDTNQVSGNNQKKQTC